MEGLLRQSGSKVLHYDPNLQPVYPLGCHWRCLEVTDSPAELQELSLEGLVAILLGVSRPNEAHSVGRKPLTALTRVECWEELALVYGALLPRRFYSLSRCVPLSAVKVYAMICLLVESPGEPRDRL